MARTVISLTTGLGVALAAMMAAHATLLPPEPLTFDERSEGHELVADDDTACAWIKSRLGVHDSGLNEIAKENGVPANLLAAVILNELGDINAEDVLQDQNLAEACNSNGRVPFLPSLIKTYKRQSFGIAQITPNTAMEANAVPIDPSFTGDRHWFTACSLLNRTTAIHASAKIIRKIMDKMAVTSHVPLMQRFLQPGTKFDADQPFANINIPGADNLAQVRPETLYRAREAQLAAMVSSIYNSASYLKVLSDQVDDDRFYRDARKHAKSAAVIGRLLHKTKACGMALDQVEHTPDGTTGDGTAGGGGQPSGDLQNCLCGCLVGRTNFSCSYDTEDRGWSPSCRNLENGACICKATGCFRKPPVSSGECHAACVQKFGSGRNMSGSTSGATSSGGGSSSGGDSGPTTTSGTSSGESGSDVDRVNQLLKGLSN